jgi:hypothetical protein
MTPAIPIRALRRRFGREHKRHGDERRRDLLVRW